MALTIEQKQFVDLAVKQMHELITGATDSLIISGGGPQKFVIGWKKTINGGRTNTYIVIQWLVFSESSCFTHGAKRASSRIVQALQWFSQQ
jgi:hypothetical protein